MKKVIGYVSTKDLGTLKEQDIKNLDVINIAFGLIERHRVVWDSCGNEEYLPKIREINPDIKIVLSVGGWGADGFSQAARTEEGRALFAVSRCFLCCFQTLSQANRKRDISLRSLGFQFV